MPANRKKKKELHDSCRRLLEKCLPNFTQGETVRYSDVNDLYEDNNAFFRDCNRIKKKLDEIRDWLELLGVSVPFVKYKDGCLQIPVRGFVARICPELREVRTRLAGSLIAHRYKGEPLVPRRGTLYFGFGTTIFAVAEHLCKYSNEFDEISISSSNIEILVYYYVVAPTIFRRGHFLLPGGGEIDWNGGCVIPISKDSEITTSIISFEAMDRQGHFYADTSRKRDLVQNALENTRRRIILVGDRNKFTPGNGYLISLPVNREQEIFLFTNGRLPNGYNLAEGVTLVRTKKS